MTERTKRIDAMPTIAYASACGGIDIKQIEYGTDDHIVCISNAWNGRQCVKAHRVKIYYDAARPYFFVYSYKIFLDECIRTGV